MDSSSASVVKISLAILFRYQPVYSFTTYCGRFGCSTVPQFVPQMTASLQYSKLVGMEKISGGCRTDW
jgi:hypothetical protein